MGEEGIPGQSQAQIAFDTCMSQTESLEVRLATLERRLRVHRAFAAVSGLIAVVLLTVAAQDPKAGVPEVLQARRIEVLDERGNALVVLGESKHAGEILLNQGTFNELRLAVQGPFRGPVLQTRLPLSVATLDHEGRDPEQFLEIDTHNSRLEIHNTRNASIGVEGESMVVTPGSIRMLSDEGKPQAEFWNNRLWISNGEGQKVAELESVGSHGDVDVGSLRIYRGKDEARDVWLTSWEGTGYLELMGTKPGIINR